MSTPARTLLVIAVVASLSGCETATGPGSEWQLVGVYDSVALANLQIQPEDDDGADAYVWVPAPGMTRSCGPAKSPDGLGVFEAEVLANDLSPYLAVVLRRTVAGSAPLTPQDVRIGLGRDKLEYVLQPAVVPRYISARIEGDGSLRFKQQVRTQLQMELCLEHKAGRGWIGGDETQLRQAFLLDPQTAGGLDRRYFGGQRDPVPALLGPPDACFQPEPGESGGVGKALRGQGSLDFVPSDVWGASLRPCAVDEVGGAALAGLRRVDLTVGETLGQPKRRRTRAWQELVVDVHAGESEADVTLDVSWQGEQLLDGAPLFVFPEDGGPPGTTDLLGRVPYQYPLVGTVEQPNEFTVLLVPNWQVTEGVRRLGAEDFKAARPTAGEGIQDGVGWLLANAQYLYVQLPVRSASNKKSWLNVAEPLGGGPLRLMDWGYVPGLLTGRQPVILATVDEPTWDQTAVSHRGMHQAALLGSTALVLGVVLVGWGRRRDLWLTVPEERVVFWPGSSVEDDEDEGGDVDLPEGGDE